MKKVSVIIPSYNHKQFIEQTINSVLEQAYSNLELIIIDDGSTDGTPILLKELASTKEFRLILKENEGVCATLNRGLKEATGEYITFIASDDFMTKNRIQEQVEFLECHQDVEVVAGAVKVVNLKSEVVSTKKPRALGYLTFEGMIKQNLIFAPTAMLRKDVFEKHGNYKEEYAFEDYYMWLKILKNEGRIFNTNNIWAYYRMNTTNFEKRFNWYYKGYAQTLSDYLPDPKAKKMLSHNLVIYSLKMSFLLGKQFVLKYRVEFSGLPMRYKFLMLLISLGPSFLRNRMLFFLMKNI
jgi:alpha-1,3-rhamnosyltransferase